MRVLLLSAANSVHTVRWANAFAQRGVEVHLVSQHVPAAGLLEQVVVHCLPHRHGLGYVWNGPQLARLVRTLAPDVLNAHYATGYGTLARWIGRVPLVLNVWGSDVYSFPEKSYWHKRLLVGNLLHADHIVSTSEAMAARTRSLTERPLSITVVPFGVDTDRFRPRASERREAIITIGTVKTLEPVYGVDRLVEAFIVLCGMEGLPPVQLRIAGGGSERTRLEGMLRSAGLAQRAVFTGAVPHDQVPAELAKSDIYVALSRSESFGVAVIEASACGLPVVVTDAGGLPEVVTDGVTGLVVPNGDGAKAVEALTRLVRDPDLRARLGQAGRARVLANYAWNGCVDRMLGVLMNAFKQQRP
jgi:glycosyltransferase involved in cell wall biosynthesis